MLCHCLSMSSSILSMLKDLAQLCKTTTTLRPEPGTKRDSMWDNATCHSEFRWQQKQELSICCSLSCSRGSLHRGFFLWSLRTTRPQGLSAFLQLLQHEI